MIILDGKKLAEKILNKLKKEIKSRRLKLKLAVVLVGKDFSSRIFVKQKEKAAKKIGVGFRLYRFSERINSEKLKKEVKRIAEDNLNSGIVIQLPLPKNINTSGILNVIPKGKDIDILSDASFRDFSEGKSLILPPTAEAVNYLLKEYKIRLRNKKIIIVGTGRLVGKPLSFWFKKQKSDFLTLDEKTKNNDIFIKKADILISGVGKPNLIKGDMIKEGVVAIDFGGGRFGNGVVGDINFKSVSRKASYIAPVPGGVGPMTVACLFKNLVRLNKDLAFGKNLERFAYSKK